MRKYFPKNSTLGMVYSVAPALKQDGTQFAIPYLVFIGYWILKMKRPDFYRAFFYSRT